MNWGTVMVGLIILGIVAAIVYKLVSDKKKGKCPGCDCGCAGCPMSDGDCSTGDTSPGEKN